MADYFLKLTNISKTFGGVQALKSVNLEIGKGEIHCLAGENGCGKSTLIKIISGVYLPDEGDILINNRHYKYITPIDSIMEGIQVIYQDFSIFPNLSVAENIALNTELAEKRRLVNWNWIYKIAKNALNKINVTIDLTAQVGNLSVAEKQLVAISRALIQNAKLIIMDEPTSALTKKEVKALFNVIKNLQNHGISILFVSHKIEEVFEISDKLTILRNGQNVISGDIKDFDTKKFSYFMTGKEIDEQKEIVTFKRDKVLLKVDNLMIKGYFSGVSFELFQGEILGITGLLGSGRTELAMSLFGLKKLDKGNIYINEKLVKINSVQDAIKYGIAYVPEDRLTEGLFLPQSIGRNIIISIIDKLLNKWKFISNEIINIEINKWISDLRIATTTPYKQVQLLSGGNQQKVVLAKWLSTKPKILILNGPTTGVDIGSKLEIYKLLKILAKQGIGIIIISDDIPEILNNCNEILIMKKGKIIKKFDNFNTSSEELSELLS
ncbi:MAG: sugar ABC transporter ATP-binding protein [bacterium]